MGSHIRSLPVERCRIVGLPEYGQQFLVTDYCWIVFDVDYFGVTGVSSADFFITGIFLCSPSEAAGDGFYARQHLKNRFRAPVTSATEGGSFRFIC
jgi:hypothetical protein